MSKIRCMRTSSNTPRTCFDMPQSFTSPPLAFSLRKHEMKAPSPELSTKRSRLRSNTSFVVASSNGATSRLKSAELLASSSFIGTTATVTSPTLSNAIAIVSSFTSGFMHFDEGDAVSTALVAIIAHVVDAHRDEIHAESGLSGTIEGGWGHRRGIERISKVMQTDRDTVRKRFGFEIDTLIGAPMVG